jgi:hypothetical protein
MCYIDGQKNKYSVFIFFTQNYVLRHQTFYSMGPVWISDGKKQYVFYGLPKEYVITGGK